MIIRTLYDVERCAILDALTHCGGNRTQTAKALGISLRAMRNKIAEYRADGLVIPGPTQALVNLGPIHEDAKRYVFAKCSIQRVSPHFKAREFDCPCAKCTTTAISKRLIELLEAFRGSLELPVTITSGFRCYAHQRELEGQGYETAKGISMHELGEASDLFVAGMTGAALEDHARDVGFKAVGVGRTFIHADTRDDKPRRRWTYS